MLLCIDIGNSHIYGGVFLNDKIQLYFRHTAKACTSDEIGIFLINVLKENHCQPTNITQISICSVVPQLDYSVRAACVKYFHIEPLFLHYNSQKILNLKYHNPIEIGADRIANAIAAVHFIPNKNLIIIDFGTATTFCVITSQKEYLGGAILPGLRLSMEALSNNTAKLPNVEIIKSEHIIGKSTIESIQSGIFYGAIGACREIIKHINNEILHTTNEQNSYIIATGGFAGLFEQQNIFNQLMPDLVLHGIRLGTIVL